MEDYTKIPVKHLLTLAEGKIKQIRGLYDDLDGINAELRRRM